MAIEEHVRILAKGVPTWNKWRRANPRIRPNLDGIKLVGSFGVLDGKEVPHGPVTICPEHCEGLIGASDYIGINLSDVDLNNCTLAGMQMERSDFSGATLHMTTVIDSLLNDCILTRASCIGARFIGSDLRGSLLRETELREGALYSTQLAGCDLTEADLSLTTLVNTNLADARLHGCYVYGSSAWNLILEGASQRDIVITHYMEPSITVDNIEVAQFIYLLLNNQRIRHVIDTVTSKVVLILGRFTPTRKVVLDAIRDELRNRDYIPVLFDFERPEARNLSETVSTLAHMSRFVIADITHAKSIPQELERLVPHLPSVPIQPIRLDSSQEYGMFPDFREYPWVLDTCTYSSTDGLLAELPGKIIAPAEAKAEAIAAKRRQLEKELAV